VRAAAGEAIARHVLRLPGLARAPRVALYAALPDELPTRPLFEALAAMGCERLLPRIEGGHLAFAPVSAWDELIPGPLRVPEPPPSRRAVRLLPGDVALIPGVAFDREGNRLGRGGGYYDRSFAGTGPLLVGVGFRLQLVASVPHDSRDRPMDVIVTEEGPLFAEGKT
jgi:5-formyltetrahydrofolate cyclo-ligase